MTSRFYIKLNIKKIEKNIVIITSKIIVSDNKLNYANNRSIYSSDERFTQTLNTIDSIKNNIPNYYIILLDNSDLDITKVKILNESVDIFINLTSDKKLNYYTNISKYKAYGEIYQTKIILDVISNLINLNKLNILNLFKITARYIINKNFNYDNYNNNYNIFKLNTNVTNRKYYYTCFYKISNNNFTYYFNIINELFYDIVVKKTIIYNEIDLEVFFPKKLNQFKIINELGITQNISVWNDKTMI